MTAKFVSLLNRLDFATKYPLLSQHISDYHGNIKPFDYEYSDALHAWTPHFSKYISKQAGIVKKYGQLIQLSIPEYIRNICNKTKKLYKYKIYYENDIEQFRLVRFLIDFFGKSINVILQVFSEHNLICKIPQKFKQHAEICLAMKKIYDTHMAITLAKYFAEIDVQVRHNLFPMYGAMLVRGSRSTNLICKLVEEDVDHILFQKMVHENEFDLKDDLMKSLSDYQSYCVDPNHMMKLAICYGIFKGIYDFFKYKTKLREYIASIPDLESNFGGCLMNISVNDKSISSALRRAIRNMYWDHLWLEKIIDPINKPNKMEKFDLKIPICNQPIHNGPIIIDI